MTPDPAAVMDAMSAYQDARSGAAIAVLQSSEMGYRVYRGLGLEDFGRYRSVLRSDD